MLHNLFLDQRIQNEAATNNLFNFSYIKIWALCGSLLQINPNDKLHDRLRCRICDSKQRVDSHASVKRSSLPEAAQEAAQHHEDNPDEVSVVTGPSPPRELHLIPSLVDPTELPED